MRPSNRWHRVNLNSLPLRRVSGSCFTLPIRNSPIAVIFRSAFTSVKQNLRRARMHACTMGEVSFVGGTYMVLHLGLGPRGE